MLIGSAGCGKTVLINEKLAQLDENYLVANVPFNYYYTAEMLQKVRNIWFLSPLVPSKREKNVQTETFSLSQFVYFLRIEPPIVRKYFVKVNIDGSVLKKCTN